jgi:hypothetical protein
MKNNAARACTLLIATLVIATLGSAGCDGPPDRAALVQETPGSRVDVVEVPAPALGRVPAAVAAEISPAPAAATIPESLRAEKITAVNDSCRIEDGRPVATIAYQAVRGDKVDEVVLTFSSENGYGLLNHKRGDRDLGTVRVDVVMGGEPVFPELVSGQEIPAAHLLAELPSPALAAVLPATQECLYQGIEGQITRDGETYFYKPTCDFPYAALDVIAAAAADSAARACCASAPGNLSCTDCQRGARAASAAFDRQSDPLQQQMCDERAANDDGY